MPESNPETHFSFSLDILSDESMGCGEQAEPCLRWAEPLLDRLPSDSWRSLHGRWKWGYIQKPVWE